MQKAYGDAVRLASSKPSDPGALLLLAEATVAYCEKGKKGDLDRALSATRKARKLNPILHESLFWEGAVQAAAGRREKARDSLIRFIEVARTHARYRTLIKSAEKRVHALAAPEE